MILCEYCNKDHNGTLGSGRFCSLKCSRGFSTKSKRSKINEKVSNKLKKFKIYSYYCNFCKKEFKTKRKRIRQYCSKSCQSKGNWDNNTYRIGICKKLALKQNRSMRSIPNIFHFKNINVKCDSLLENKGLEKIISLLKISNIERCDFTIPYIIDGKIHQYNPDFKITTEEKLIYILECKTTISKKLTNISSRPHYFNSIPYKREALIEFGKTNDFGIIWFSGTKIDFIINPFT